MLSQLCDSYDILVLFMFIWICYFVHPARGQGCLGPWESSAACSQMRGGCKDDWRWQNHFCFGTWEWGKVGTIPCRVSHTTASSCSEVENCWKTRRLLLLKLKQLLRRPMLKAVKSHKSSPWSSTAGLFAGPYSRGASWFRCWWLRVLCIRHWT